MCDRTEVLIGRHKLSGAHPVPVLLLGLKKTL
jgi:hypothetical protein